MCSVDTNKSCVAGVDRATTVVTRIETSLQPSAQLFAAELDFELGERERECTRASIEYQATGSPSEQQCFAPKSGPGHAVLFEELLEACPKQSSADGSARNNWPCGNPRCGGGALRTVACRRKRGELGRALPPGAPLTLVWLGLIWLRDRDSDRVLKRRCRLSILRRAAVDEASIPC